MKIIRFDGRRFTDEELIGERDKCPGETDEEWRKRIGFDFQCWQVGDFDHGLREAKAYCGGEEGEILVAMRDFDADDIILKLYETTRERWGGWTLDRATQSLEHDRPRYVVDLKRCRTSAQTLDWLVHIASKGWAPEVVGNLVIAIHEVLRPMQTMCGGGIETSGL